MSHPSTMPIPFSTLELAFVPEGISVGQTFANVLDFARKAEQFGYRRIWLAEHHNTISIASSATAVLIGYVAQGTQTIRVGSGGIMLPNHSPLIVAEQFGTLATLYPGRIDLGLGRAPGTDQLTANAINPGRMQAVNRFPQDIAEIQRYLSVENSSTNVRVPFAEGVDIPIYILGSSTDSAYLAADQGLPYAFASHFATTYLFDALEIYHSKFQPSEYLDKPYTIACVNVLAADTQEKAETYLASLIRMFVGVLTGRREYLQPPSPLTDDLRALLSNQSLFDMMRYTFVGDKSAVKSQTQEFLRATGIDEIMIVSNIHGHSDRVRSLEIFAEAMREIDIENSPKI